MEAVARDEEQTVKEVSDSSSTASEIIKKRQASELIFAFCGPIGSGVSFVADKFRLIISRLVMSLERSKCQIL
ncbi:MAG: hypothetical protein HQK94_19405 [Nitrospirae bacterium]|nr:hypothetical protein [Nitrospirota bacterium]